MTDEEKSLPSDSETLDGATSKDEASEASDDSSKSQANPAKDDEVFHEEGEMKFKTKDEYLEYTKKRLGDASRVVGENKKLKEELNGLREIVKTKLAEPKKEGEAVSWSDEEKEALKKLNGVFVSKEELGKMLDERLAEAESVAKRVKSREAKEAEETVREFLQLNPDALEVAEKLSDTLIGFEKAGIDAGIEEAYMLVTKKHPKTSDGVADEKEKQALKAAQAGGSSSSAQGKAKTERDFFDTILDI